MRLPFRRSLAVLACAVALTPAALAVGDVRILSFGVAGCTLRLMPGKGLLGSALVREWSLDGTAGARLGVLGKVGDTVTVPGRKCDIEFDRVSATEGFEMDLGVIPPSGSTPTFHLVSLPRGDQIEVAAPTWSGSPGQVRIQTGDKLKPLIEISAFK